MTSSGNTSNTSNTSNASNASNTSNTSNTDNITLEYLLNPVYQTGINRTKNEDNENDVSLSNADVKFYRKRISALSREIMRGNVANNSVTEAHDEYVKAAIQYFQMSDRTEILQNEYDGAGEDTKDGTNNEHFNIGQANEILFEKLDTPPTLDNFVTSKTVNIRKDVKHPQRRNINLKTNELRLKGIQSKKDKQMKREKEVNKEKKI